MQRGELNFEFCFCEHLLRFGQALKGVLVNIFDLIDARRANTQVQQFRDFNTFRNYTENGRKFPREWAKAEGFLAALLKVL
jgi:hypothetical protein